MHLDRYVMESSDLKGVKNMLSNIGVPGLILILVLALIIFGPKNCLKLVVPLDNPSKNLRTQQKGLWKMIK